jgi:hypothetical protein
MLVIGELSLVSLESRDLVVAQSNLSGAFVVSEDSSMDKRLVGRTSSGSRFGGRIE